MALNQEINKNIKICLIYFFSFILLLSLSLDTYSLINLKDDFIVYTKIKQPLEFCRCSFISLPLTISNPLEYDDIYIITLENNFEWTNPQKVITVKAQTSRDITINLYIPCNEREEENNLVIYIESSLIGKKKKITLPYKIIFCKNLDIIPVAKKYYEDGCKKNESLMLYILEIRNLGKYDDSVIIETPERFKTITTLSKPSFEIAENKKENIFVYLDYDQEFYDNTIEKLINDTYKKYIYLYIKSKYSDESYKVWLELESCEYHSNTTTEEKIREELKDDNEEESKPSLLFKQDTVNCEAAHYYYTLKNSYNRTINYQILLVDLTDNQTVDKKNLKLKPNYKYNLDVDIIPNCKQLKEYYLIIKELDSNKTIMTHAVFIRQISTYDYFRPQLPKKITIHSSDIKENVIMTDIPLYLNSEANYIITVNQTIDNETITLANNLYLFNKSINYSSKKIGEKLTILIPYNKQILSKLKKGYNLTLNIINDHNQIYEETLILHYQTNYLITFLLILSLATFIMAIVYVVLLIKLSRKVKRREKTIVLGQSLGQPKKMKREEPKIGKWIAKQDKENEKLKKKEIKEGKKTTKELLETTKKKPKKWLYWFLPLVIIVLAGVLIFLYFYRPSLSHNIDNITITNITNATANITLVESSSENLFNLTNSFINTLYHALLSYWIYILIILAIASAIFLLLLTYHKNIRLFRFLVWLIYIVVAFTLVFYTTQKIRNNFILMQNEYNTITIPEQDKMNIVMYKDETKIIDLKEYFYDPDNDKLFYTINSDKHLLVELDEIDNTLKIKPKKGFSGISWLVISATDNKSDEVKTPKITIHILPLDKRPETFLQKAWFLIRTNYLIFIIIIIVLFVLTLLHSFFDNKILFEKESRDKDIIDDLLKEGRKTKRKIKNRKFNRKK